MNQTRIIKSGRPVNYTFDEKYFSIDSPIEIDPHFLDTIQNIDLIKKATEEIENIVQIHSAKKYINNYNNAPRALVKTEFLNNYFPMILMKSNESMYSPEEANLIKNKFKELLSKDIHFLQNYYDSIILTYQNFIDKTGFYFFDISSNNIMLHKDNFNFKIIDVFSIKKAEFTEKQINPLSVLLYHNIVKHSCTTEDMVKQKCTKFFQFLQGSVDIIEVINKISLIKPKKIFNREK